METRKVHDSKVLPDLLNPLLRKIRQVSADGAYDTRECYEVIAKKNAKSAIPPRSNAAMWEAEHPRNNATTALHNGKIEEWKVKNDYHKRSLSETAMYRWKQLMGAKLTFRNYNAQAGEVYAGIKALNKLTGLGLPQRESFVG